MIPKDIYSNIIEEYMDSVFGKTIGQNLFEVSQKRQKVVFTELSDSEKFIFLNKMLNRIYSGFYSSQKIQLIVVNLFFKFARFRIGDKIEATLKQAVDVSEPSFTHDTLENEKDISHIIDSDLTLFFEVKGIIGGGIAISIEQHSIELLSKYLAQANGTTAKGGQQSVISFFQIVAPQVMEIVEDNFEKKGEIKNIEKKEFFEKYVTHKEGYVIELITTPFSWTVDNREISCNAAFLRQNNSEEVKELLERKNKRSKQKLFKEKTPTIIVKYSDDIEQNCKNFLTFVFEEQGQHVFETTITKLGERLTPQTSHISLTGFIKILLGHFMKKEIDTKVDFVQKNLEVILGLDKH